MFETSEKMTNQIIQAVQNVKSKTPLVNCTTNAVTINDCANAILAIGGSPIMGDDPREIEKFIEIADALVINMGAVRKSQIEAMRIGSTYAKKINTPIVLDPVGVGISDLRNKIILEFINDSKLSVIRGNMTEIKAIANLVDLDEVISSNKSESKGVDVSEYDVITEENLQSNGGIVKALSNEIDTVIIASGAIDIISNGKSVYACENGDSMMSKITGTGCMLTSIVGSFCGANEPLLSAVSATIAMGIAGGQAGKFVKEENSGTGTFRVKLIDYLSNINSNILLKNAKLHEINID